MKKIIALLMAIMMIASVFVGCTTETKTEVTEAKSEAKETDETVENTETPAEPVDVKIGAPLGSPAISLVKLMKENPEILPNYNVTYEGLPAPDQLATMIINEEIDMIVVPTNLAAKLYNKGVNYQLASSNVWGTMYVVSTEEINSFEDLKGKEMTSFGMGLTPDVLFNYLLEKNLGEDKDQVTINYVNAGSEVAPLIISGKTSIAVLPEPLVTVVKMKNENVKVVLDFQKEYEKVSDAGNLYPQASLLVNKTFAEENKAFVSAFLAEYETSTTWINENPMEAGAYYEALEFGLKQPIVAKGLPGMNLKYVASEDAKAGVEEYLNMLLEYSPESIGGQLPDENFYYEK